MEEQVLFVAKEPVVITELHLLGVIAEPQDPIRMNQGDQLIMRPIWNLPQGRLFEMIEPME